MVVHNTCPCAEVIERYKLPHSRDTLAAYEDFEGKKKKYIYIYGNYMV